MEDKNRNFLELSKFFMKNAKIKYRMMSLAPPDGNDYLTLEEYSYSLKEFIEQCAVDFIHFNNYFDMHIEEEIVSLLTRIYNNIDKCKHLSSYSKDEFENLYKTDITGMSDSLIENLNLNCSGYRVDNYPELYINDCKTINDLLHMFHTYIINNENIIQNMPILKNKEKNADEKITLYGKEEELANNIFFNIPDNLCLGGYTDILSLPANNLIIMMIRDRGHALTIQIDTSDKNNLYIKYFIPKICNLDMVNNLPGVRKAKINQRFTDGAFTTNAKELPIEIINFISSVPTDMDMDIDKENNAKIH